MNLFDPVYSISLGNIRFKFLFVSKNFSQDYCYDPIVQGVKLSGDMFFRTKGDNVFKRKTEIMFGISQTLFLFFFARKISFSKGRLK